jgi:hypothetical protein
MIHMQEYLQITQKIHLTNPYFYGRMLEYKSIS